MITATVTGLNEAIAALNRLGRLDKGGLMQQVSRTVSRQTRDRILRDKTAPSGAAWAPLKPSTVARKGNANIMVNTGRLARSVTFRADSSQAVISLGVFYARFHHSGTRKMVARPAIGLSGANQSEVELIVTAFVQRQLGR